VRDALGDAVVAAQAGHDAGEDHDEPMSAGVDHAGLPEHLQLLGGPRHRRLAVADRALQQGREQRILLGRRRLRGEPGLLHVSEPAGDRVRHLPEDGQHRPLGGLPDRVVRGVGGARKCGRHQRRVDQLAGPAGELLGGPADDLAEDHPGVASGSHQRRPGEGVDELRAADLVNQLAVEAVELVADRPQGERHVVAGVAVGDREDIEVVDLLAPLLEVGGGRVDDATESLYGGIGHAERELWGSSRRRLLAEIHQLSASFSAVYCPRCGHENKAGDRFCSNCGATLVHEEKVPKEKRSWRERAAGLIGTTRAAQLTTAGIAIAIVVALIAFLTLNNDDDIPRDDYTVTADEMCVTAKQQIGTAANRSLTAGVTVPSGYAAAIVPIVADWQRNFSELDVPTDRTEEATSLNDALVQVLIEAGALARLPGAAPSSAATAQAARVDAASQEVENAVADLGLDDCEHLQVTAAPPSGG
jgi:hypothetical protein